ncbi:glycoside hydrolase family 43 protein [Streptococcus moroccensis]|uniref:Alpha-N-arabinofuranosidase n=1 Tax=Streptococcus moroccensis TaxID=1451356 RepID=A0ABT9YT89_9STRE|nr:glycoside hydrolase family 43 protein [Streptococcus moroccensis]MDQ0223216.1 alpha-N-arabinofuranosidase [Streptococcus moroccensis]
MTVTHYQNPILRGMYPDPSIVRVGETYYMVNSTFEYFPGIALSTSTDLLNWTKLPSIVTNPEQADLRQSKSNEGIFAVCIRYHNGHFYVITTNFAEFKNFIIRGRLADDGQAIIWEDSRVVVDIFGIDPDLYFEEDKTYIQFTGYIDDKGTKAIQQVEIDLETGAIIRGPEVLTLGTGGRDVEGPHIIKKDGYYYLLMAEGGTGLGHMITMFRGQNLWGPFNEAAPKNPLFTNRDRADEPLQNIGHADIFQDTASNWWMTCLGTRPAAVGFVHFTNIGRETLLYPVDWSGDWPVINGGVPSQVVDMTTFPDHAKALENPQVISDFVDNFDSPDLNPEWVSLRSDLTDRLQVGTGSLSLTGSAIRLDELATPSFLALRQTEHEENFEVVLDTANTLVNQGRLGLAVTINSDHFASLTLEAAPEGGYQFIKHVRVLDLEVETVVGHSQTLPTRFTLEHTVANKAFKAHFEDGSSIGFDIHAMHFSNEAIAALNTGDFYGLYVLDDAQMVVTGANRRAK